MKFIDAYEGIAAVYEEDGFDLARWRRYASGISPQLVKKAEGDIAEKYDFNKDVLPVLNAAYVKKEKLEQAHDSFLCAIKGLGARFNECFGMDMDVRIILYLGLCNGAGWATELDGKRTVLLGIEKLVELDWCSEEKLRALIYHELGHIWHGIAGMVEEEAKTQRERSIRQLYNEGVAMLAEQILCGDMEHYHQYDGDWQHWCEKNEGDIAKEYLRRIIEDESTQDFFGDWCQYKGHSDTGYFIGCQFVKEMFKSLSLKEIANMDVEEIAQRFARYARSL